MTTDTLYVHSDGISLEPPTAAPYFSVKWNGEDVQVGTHATFVGMAPETLGEHMSRIAYTLAPATDTLRYAHQAARLDVRALGLEPRSVARGGSGYYPNAPALRRAFSENEMALAFIGGEELQWFLPGSFGRRDFGTPYLVLRRAKSGVASWSMHLTGTNAIEPAMAAWDDAEGLSELVRQMHEMDAEYVHALGMLTNAAEFQADHNRHLYHAGISDARNAYKSAKSRVKPRLCQEVIDFAYGQVRYEYSDAPLIFQPAVEANQLRIARTRNLPPLNASLSVGTYTYRRHDRDSAFYQSQRDFIDRLGQKLKANLAARKLGQVALVTSEGRDPKLLIFTDLGLLMKHRAAHGILAEATITVL